MEKNQLLVQVSSRNCWYASVSGLFSRYTFAPSFWGHPDSGRFKEILLECLVDDNFLEIGVYKRASVTDFLVEKPVYRSDHVYLLTGFGGVIRKPLPITHLVIVSARSTPDSKTELIKLSLSVLDEDAKLALSEVIHACGYHNSVVEQGFKYRVFNEDLTIDGVAWLDFKRSLYVWRWITPFLPISKCHTVRERFKGKRVAIF